MLFEEANEEDERRRGSDHDSVNGLVTVAKEKRGR